MSKGTGIDAPKWAVKKGREAEMAARAARWGAWTGRRHETSAADLTAWGWELRGRWEAETMGYIDLACWIMLLTPRLGRDGADYRPEGLWVPRSAAETAECLALIGTPSERVAALLRAGPGHPELEAELALAALAGHPLPAYDGSARSGLIWGPRAGRLPGRTA